MTRLKIFSVGMFLMIFFIFSGKSFGFERILRVSDGTIIDFNQMIAEIKAADLIFVGEVHASIQHHKFQLNVIKALNDSKVPVAIGIEMFRASSQKELDQWVEGTMPFGTFVDVYSNNWGMPWPWYMNIFKYARQYGIPMIGLNVSGEITEKVSRHGFDALTTDELKLLPSGMRFDIDDRYKAHVRKIYEAHERSDSSFDNFCTAQMIWDKTMAYHLMNFLKKNPGRTVVALAGAEHAGGMGIPGQIKKQSKYRYKIILPEIRGRVEKDITTGEDADYLILE